MKLYWLAMSSLMVIVLSAAPGCSRQDDAVGKEKPQVVHDMNIVKPDKDSPQEITNEAP